MSAYIPFDPHVHMRGEKDPYATPATPATPALKEASTASNDVEITCAAGSEPSCDSLRLSATRSGKVAPSRRGVAMFPEPSGDELCGVDSDEEARPRTQSRKSRKSRIDISPTTHIDPIQLTAQFPCVVCGGRERWDHHGLWRCVACWPPEAFGLIGEDGQSSRSRLSRAV